MVQKQQHQLGTVLVKHWTCAQKFAGSCCQTLVIKDERVKPHHCDHTYISNTKMLLNAQRIKSQVRVIPGVYGLEDILLYPARKEKECWKLHFHVIHFLGDGRKPLDTLNQEKGTPPSNHSFVMALHCTSKI